MLFAVFPSCRLHWEDLAGKIGDQFQIETLASSVDESLLRKAKALYADSLGNAPSGAAVQGSSSGSKDASGGQRQWSNTWTGKRKWDEDSKDSSKKYKGMEAIKCFGCKQYGHLLQDCPNRKKSKSD